MLWQFSATPLFLQYIYQWRRHDDADRAQPLRRSRTAGEPGDAELVLDGVATTLPAEQFTTQLQLIQEAGEDYAAYLLQAVTEQCGTERLSRLLDAVRVRTDDFPEAEAALRAAVARRGQGETAGAVES
ncbi:hypothetical protein [Streptomyces sp. SYSU K21746]